jgi:DNA helicase-2/ATP-dependent DNA helicase PcrA
LGNYEQDLIAETAHYDKTLDVIKSQLQAAKSDIEKSEKSLRETNRDMWENAPHSSGDFDGAVELSQYYQPLASNIYAVESGAEKVRQLERQLQSAYFARIDFRAEGNAGHDNIYIGRGSLMDRTGKRFCVYDWRSPIASLFYRFETGDSFYDAPCGRITGDVSLKRQYEIKKGIFEYFFDADVQIADQFLRKMLSGNTSGKMKTIVETIQKDQDIAIRDMSHDLLMIQGVAGSGKTSVALHRVAYLKYQGLSGRLKSSDIMILSPNTLFEQYIGEVLPELGEDEVKSVTFDELIKNTLPHNAMFRTRYEKTEALISCADPVEKALHKQAMEFKMSGAFVEILNRYAQSLAVYHIEFTDIEYDGEVVFTGENLKDRLLQMNNKGALAVNLNLLRRYIFDEIHKRRKNRMPKLLQIARDSQEHPFDWEEYARSLSIDEHTRISKKIDGFTKLDSVALYKKLMNTDDLLTALAQGIELPDNIGEILLYSREWLKDPLLQNEDALAVTYLQLLTGAGCIRKQIKQVVVDEVQDYYSIHFETLRLLFPNARYTMLGDVNQTIEKREDMKLYKRITESIRAKSACLMTLSKSFRCTKEILAFAAQYLDGGAPIESFNRSGDLPKVISADNTFSLDERLLAEVVYSKEQGYESIGIICKDAAQAEKLYERLKDRTALHLVRFGDNLNTSGVFIIPITMSKGLEFDSVLVYGADKERYYSDDDKKLLYIASTRALHRLNLFYMDEASPLIGGDEHDA